MRRPKGPTTQRGNRECPAVISKIKDLRNCWVNFGREVSSALILGLLVKGVELDECGGIRIELESDCVLEVFPDSGKMQWIFKSPDRHALVLINGVVNKSKKKPAGVKGEEDATMDRT
jgi:hypothetical protein